MTLRRITHLLVSLGLGFGLGSWAAGARAAQDVVLYGDDDYPPYSYVEQGQFKGLYVDLLRLAAKAMPGYRIDLQPRPWRRGLAELEKGTSFGLFPPGMKAERTFIAPYSVPLYRETVALFCHPDVMKTARKHFPADFSGLTIGVNAGFLLSQRLIDAAHLGLVTLEPAKGNEANLKKLALKRIACYASDRAAARYSAKLLRGYLAQLDFTLLEALELSGEDTFIAYSANNTPPYKADFIAKMNAALELLRINGEAARIANAYLH